MNAQDRVKLLKLISDGHDPEAAAVALGIDVSTVTQPGRKLKAAIKSALRVGTARLRSKVMELALSDGDIRALEKQLERREAQVADEPGLTRIERIIVAPQCA